jgi:hypothetical protein
MFTTAPFCFIKTKRQWQLSKIAGAKQKQNHCTHAQVMVDLGMTSA